MKKLVTILIMMLFTGMLLAQIAEPPTIGTGTTVNPYQIATLNNLCWLSQNSSEWDQKHYIQTADINASDTYNWNAGAGFSPIGITETAFSSCSYDGRGFVIDSLFINISSDFDHGFFGKVISSTFENINLTNVNITGYSGVGALVGYSDGSDFTNCTSSGNVNGYERVGGLIGDSYAYSAFNNITNCHSSCDVTGSGGEKIGGLIGTIYHSNVSNCSTAGTVSSSNSYVGGLIGYINIMTVSRSFATGDVSGNENVGGLLGYAYASGIGNCYARGSVTGSSNTGGLVGYLNQCSNNSPDKSYSTGFINGAGTYVGGLVGQIYWGTVTNSFFDYETAGTTSNSAGGARKTTIEMTDVSTFTDSTHTDLSEPWDFVGNPNYDTANDDIWDIDSELNNGYPFLSWQKLKADFTVSSTNLVAGQSVHFSDASDGFSTDWEWDFDNNGTVDSIEKNPTYIYTLAGTYTVTLTITNAEDSSTETKVDYITVNTPSISRDLVAHYPFNGNPNDTSGNNHHGTNNGATLTTDRFGETESAYDFDGTDDYMDLGNWFNFNDFTISLWINRDAIGTDWRVILDNNHSTVNWTIQSYQNSNDFVFGVFDGGGVNFTIDLNTWKHIVCAKNGTSMTTYVDGVLQNEALGPEIVNYVNPNLFISKWGSGGRNFNGKIDDIRMYSRGLSAAEVQMLFEESNVPPVMEMSLVSDSSIDYGTVYFELDDTQEVIIRNDGNVDLSVSDVSFSAGSSSTFSYTYDNLGGAIAPGETNSIFVTFTPDSEDSFTGTLEITNNSTNNPLFEIPLSGTGEYDEIPAPQNVIVVLDDENAVISWDAVTHTVHGIPIVIDFYVINYNDDPNVDPEDYLHLAITTDLSQTHTGVVWFAPQMFYQVIAIRDYEGQYNKNIVGTTQETKKKTWGEFKILNNIE